VNEGIILGLAGLLVGSALGLAGFWFGKHRLDVTRGRDERFDVNAARAGRIGWRLTLAGMIVMWALVQFQAVKSAAVAVGALYLFSVAAHACASVYVERRG
jgi:hypothetical protein